jgi:hypothetical protein
MSALKWIALFVAVWLFLGALGVAVVLGTLWWANRPPPTRLHRRKKHR